MKNNSLKRGFSLAAAITGLCLGIIQFIYCAIDLVNIISWVGDIGIVFQYFWELILLVVLGIIVIIMSAVSFKAFKVKEDGTLNPRLGVRITFAVFVGVAMVFDFKDLYLILGILNLILFLLVITAMCLPTVQPNGEEAQASFAVQGVAAAKDGAKTALIVDTGFMEKVRELKRMKDLFVITEEQFNVSFTKLTKDFKEEILKGMPKNEI